MSAPHTPTESERREAFIRAAHFTYGWENLESWARSMADHGLEIQDQRDELLAALKDALPGLRREWVEVSSKYAGTRFENDPAYKEIQARYINARAAIAKVTGSAA